MSERRQDILGGVLGGYNFFDIQSFAVFVPWMSISLQSTPSIILLHLCCFASLSLFLNSSCHSPSGSPHHLDWLQRNLGPTKPSWEQLLSLRDPLRVVSLMWPPLWLLEGVVLLLLRWICRCLRLGLQGRVLLVGCEAEISGGVGEESGMQ